MTDPVSHETSFLAVIEKVSMTPNLNPEIIHRMLDAQQRVLDRQAEQEFNQALNDLQSKLQAVPKNGLIDFVDKKGNERKTPFAKFEDMMKVLKPLMIANGFTVSFTSEPIEGGMLVTGTLTHKGGHCIKSAMRLPLDVSGSKNNLQGAGSTISYGRRYILDMLFNIVREGEDTDGYGAPISDDLLQEIKARIKATGANDALFMKHMKVERLEDIQHRDYGKAMNALKTKERANDAKAKGSA